MNEVTNEREVKMVELDLDFDPKTVDMLIDYAKINIGNDQKALINWSVNDILKKMVDEDRGCVLMERDHFIDYICDRWNLDEDDPKIQCALEEAFMRGALQTTTDASLVDDAKEFFDECDECDEFIERLHVLYGNERGK